MNDLLYCVLLGVDFGFEMQNVSFDLLFWDVCKKLCCSSLFGRTMISLPEQRSACDVGIETWMICFCMCFRLCISWLFVIFVVFVLFRSWLGMRFLSLIWFWIPFIKKIIVLNLFVIAYTFSFQILNNVFTFFSLIKWDKISINELEREVHK